MEMCMKIVEEFKKNETETKSKEFLVFIPYIPLVFGSIFLILSIFLNAAAVKILWISVAGIITMLGVFMPIMINKMFKGMENGFESKESENTAGDNPAEKED